MRRWIVLAAALLAVGAGLWQLRERAHRAAPQEEIDAASKAALREILRQEDGR